MNEKIAEKTSLEISRFINAPPARVYKAWIDPVQLKEWWGPEGVRTRNLTADVRVGGKYRWDLTSPEGEEMSAFGEYRELNPGEKKAFAAKSIGGLTRWKSTASMLVIHSSGMIDSSCNMMRTLPTRIRSSGENYPKSASTQ